MPIFKFDNSDDGLFSLIACFTGDGQQTIRWGVAGFCRLLGVDSSILSATTPLSHELLSELTDESDSTISLAGWVLITLFMVSATTIVEKFTKPELVNAAKFVFILLLMTIDDG